MLNIKKLENLEDLKTNGLNEYLDFTDSIEYRVNDNILFPNLYRRKITGEYILPEYKLAHDIVTAKLYFVRKISNYNPHIPTYYYGHTIATYNLIRHIYIFNAFLNAKVSTTSVFYHSDEVVEDRFDNSLHEMTKYELLDVLKNADRATKVRDDYFPLLRLVEGFCEVFIEDFAVVLYPVF